jgi:arabinofuranosyltransferase
MTEGQTPQHNLNRGTGVPPVSRFALLLLAVVTIIAVYFGWRVFWFLTDDAFIAFRYVSNSHLGYGYVWNAPPFRPVEGYTSFLWVVLLDLVWRVARLEPPEAANYLSLIFTYLTLLVGALMVLKMSSRAELARFRVLLLALVFLWVISNRTFLAWTSSGLETALFNFCLTLWVFCALFLTEGSRGWVLSISLSASLLTLSRPDGLLFAVVTLAMVAGAIYAQARSSRSAAVRLAAYATPLLIIPIHLLWRRSVYEAWLPNTYYAKTVAGRFWVQSGARYLLSFVLEYALWIWLIVLVVVIVFEVRRIVARNNDPRTERLSHGWLSKVAVLVAVGGQFFYYTVVIGGDHFEYRVYSHLILLTAISFLWMLNRLPLSLKSTVILFALFTVFSWPIPWIHWTATHNIGGRKRTVVLRAPVAKAILKEFPGTPDLLLAYPRAFDRLQDWLIGHYVCMRHQEHKNFYLYQKETLPSREAGLALPSAGYPVHIASSVGVVAWVLPRVNIIDVLGLNDYVVARNPNLTSFIVMAHERRPPEGYIECFAPNTAYDKDHFQIYERAVPLTAEKIVACEQEYAALVKTPGGIRSTAPVVKNPIDQGRVFVSQQYRDVLNREPDPIGLEYWGEHLKPCPTGSACFNDVRVSIHLVLFSAEEFQETGVFTYRLYQAAFGAPPRFAEFTQDRKQLEAYHVNDWRDPDDVIPVQRSFVDNWIRRDAFRLAYPDSLSAEEFVNRLFDTARLQPFTEARKRQIDALRAGTSRAEVLREVVEMDEFKTRENDRAQILLQFLLQLRRDVDYKDARYKPWLDKLENGESINVRHVVCLFLTSEEYQRRFGSAVTHNNAECR